MAKKHNFFLGLFAKDTAKAQADLCRKPLHTSKPHLIYIVEFLAR